MSKNFKTQTPLSKLTGQQAEKKDGELNNQSEQQSEPEKRDTSKPRKKSPGRPRKHQEPYKAVSVQLPVRLIDQWRETSNITGSMSDYLTRLIEKDMKIYYGTYKDLSE